MYIDITAELSRREGFQNSCTYSNDGVCDDGSDGNENTYCAKGTDNSDCQLYSGADDGLYESGPSLATSVAADNLLAIFGMDHLHEPCACGHDKARTRTPTFQTE